jgi:hypothetical protein
MKLFLVLVAMLWASAGFAADQPAAPQAASLSGKVLEVKHVDNFTYLRLKTKDGETWAATNRAPIDKGTEVRLENTIVITDFESKTLKKKFDKIVFGSLASEGPRAVKPGPDLGAAHAGVANAPDVADVKVPKASGANARTVAEVVTGKTALKDKAVHVRGKVVKYNPGILGTNWIHLRDGSGSASAKTNDLLVTSKNEVKIGDDVLVKGVVRTDKDFGSGYSYPVMIEASELAAK